MVSRPLTLQFFFGFLLFYTQRRETWCPGALLASAPLASAATLAANSVQVRLARISSSPSSEESEFDEMSRDAFLSTLEEEEERKSLEEGRRKVAFASPRSKRFVLLMLDQVTLPVSCGERVVVGEGEGRGRREMISGQQRFPSPKIKCTLNFSRFLRKEPARAEEVKLRSDVESAAPALTAQFSEILPFRAKTKDNSVTENELVLET